MLSSFFFVKLLPSFSFPSRFFFFFFFSNLKNTEQYLICSVFLSLSLSPYFCCLCDFLASIMCSKNMHTYKPRSPGQYCVLMLGYICPFMAALLIAANTLPYHLYFLPRLWEAVVLGNASRLQYWYGFCMMVFAEVMVYGNFLKAICTAPGYVPHDPWSRPPRYAGKTYSDNEFEVQQLDRNGKLRFCGSCDQFKPDNAHHCHFCNRCIYRMDHHCPWINNCVGRENAKYFLLFVSYIPLGAFHIVLHTLYAMMFHLGHLKLSLDMDDLTPLIMLCSSIALSLIMGICFSMFAGHFCWMTYSGETSVSAHVARKTGKAEQSRAEAKKSHLYDVFGADRRWWRTIFCFRPKRDGRDGLPDDINAAYKKQYQLTRLEEMADLV